MEREGQVTFYSVTERLVSGKEKYFEGKSKAALPWRNHLSER